MSDVILSIKNCVEKYLGREPKTRGKCSKMVTHSLNKYSSDCYVRDAVVDADMGW